MIALDADYLRNQAQVPPPLPRPSRQTPLISPPARSPVYGVIFLFKYPIGQGKQEAAQDGNYDFQAVENIFFANQVIQNACATQAILSVLLNRADLDVGEKLREFRDFTQAFPAEV